MLLVYTGIRDVCLHVDPTWGWLQWPHGCCWDGTSSAGAPHPEGTGQKSKVENATSCFEDKPVKVNHEQHRLFMLEACEGRQCSCWQRWLLTPIISHLLLSGLSNPLFLFLFYGNWCPCPHLFSWEAHENRGCSRVILFTALHPQGRTEHQHLLKTSAPFLILANRSRTHWGAEWVGQACETDRRREGRADCSHKFNLPRKWGLQYQLLAEAALPELLGQSWNHLKNLHG